jgi:hypothetical protein
MHARVAGWTSEAFAEVRTARSKAVNHLERNVDILALTQYRTHCATIFRSDSSSSDSSEPVSFEPV